MVAPLPVAPSSFHLLWLSFGRWNFLPVGSVLGVLVLVVSLVSSLLLLASAILIWLLLQLRTLTFPMTLFSTIHASVGWLGLATSVKLLLNERVEMIFNLLFCGASSKSSQASKVLQWSLGVSDCGSS